MPIITRVLFPINRPKIIILQTPILPRRRVLPIIVILLPIRIPIMIGRRKVIGVIVLGVLPAIRIRTAPLVEIPQQ